MIFWVIAIDQTESNYYWKVISKFSSNQKKIITNFSTIFIFRMSIFIFRKKNWYIGIEGWYINNKRMYQLLFQYFHLNSYLGFGKKGWYIILFILTDFYLDKRIYQPFTILVTPRIEDPGCMQSPALNTHCLGLNFRMEWKSIAVDWYGRSLPWEKRRLCWNAQVASREQLKVSDPTVGRHWQLCAGLGEKKGGLL